MNKKHKVFYWNENIKIAIYDKLNVLKKSQLSDPQKDFIQLKKLRARTKYLIITSKKAYWENVISSINERDGT